MVVVGGFAPAGLNVNNYYYDNENVGVGVVRKFCELFQLGILKLLSWDKLDPTANHLPNFLQNSLNFVILIKVYGLILFGKPD